MPAVLCSPAPAELVARALRRAACRYPGARTPTIADVRASVAAGFALLVLAGPDGGRQVLVDETGRVSPALSMRADRVCRTMRALLATRLNDATLMPLLAPLNGAWVTLASAGYQHAPTASPDTTPGTVALIVSMGAWRRGLLLKTGKRRATVVFTTRANPHRVWRKTSALADIRIGESHMPLPDLIHP